MTKVTNFGLLGNEFQLKLLSQIITDRAFGLNIVPILQTKYFENTFCKQIVSFIKDYNQKYDNQIPTLSGLKEIILSSVTDDIQKKSILEILKSLPKKALEDAESTQELSYNFCKQQEMLKALNEVQKIIQRGDFENYNSIDSIIRKAQSVVDKTDTSIELDTDLDLALEEDYRNPIPTGIQGLDDEIGGGLGKAELGMFIIPTGIGKSTILSKIGNTAYKRGFNVLQIFFEDKVKDIQRKHCSAFTNIPLNDLPKYKDQVKEAVNQAAEFGGKLILKKYPSDATTVGHIKQQLRQLKSKGVVIDMLIVDYVDCLTMDRSIEDAHTGEGAIIRQLEALCDEFNVALWTAVQSNRGGAGADVVEVDMIQGSFKRAQVGHLIISVSKSAEQKENGLATMAILKSRFGGDGRIFKDMVFQNDTLHFDTSESDLISQYAFDEDRKDEMARQKQERAMDALRMVQEKRKKSEERKAAKQSEPNPQVPVVSNEFVKEVKVEKSKKFSPLKKSEVEVE